MHRGSLFKLLRRGGNKPLEPKLQRSGAQLGTMHADPGTMAAAVQPP